MTIEFKNTSDRLKMLITESEKKTEKLENFSRIIKNGKNIRLHEKYAEQISEELASTMETNAKIEKMIKKKSLR